MIGYDIVMDGTTIKLNGLSTRCIAEAGCHGVNLNGFGEEMNRMLYLFKTKNMFTWIWHDARCNANDGNACSKSTGYCRYDPRKSRFVSSDCFSASITEQRHMNMIHIYHRVQCMKMVNLTSTSVCASKRNRIASALW